jgi:hypothetical protein
VTYIATVVQYIRCDSKYGLGDIATGFPEETPSKLIPKVYVEISKRRAMVEYVYVCSHMCTGQGSENQDYIEYKGQLVRTELCLHK